MLLPNRNASTDTYRYGFNGMEKDDEIKGDGNSYNFNARFLDSRIGRWFVIDPKAYIYSNYSPYNFVLNSPLINIDPSGETVLPVHREYTYQTPNDGDNPYTETAGFIYEKTEKALSLVMKTERGRNYVKMYMKKGDVVGEYTATEDGALHDHILQLSETNTRSSGALAVTSSQLSTKAFINSRGRKRSTKSGVSTGPLVNSDVSEENKIL